MYIDESRAKGLVNRIFRTLYNRANQPEIEFSKSNRRLCKLIKATSTKRSGMLVIGERYTDTKQWELIWGEWFLFAESTDLFLPTAIEEYKQLAFNLTFTNQKMRMGDNIFFLVMSKHALVRLIMRCGREIKNPSSLGFFLKRITHQLMFAAFELARQNLGENPEGVTLDELRDLMSRTKSDKKEGFTIIDGYYVPLSYGASFHKSGGFARTITIKTFMPEEYDSAVAALKKKSPLKTESSIFDYKDVFPFIDKYSSSKKLVV